MQAITPVFYILFYILIQLQLNYRHAERVLIIFAGTPPTSVIGGTSFVTTAPAAIMG